MRNLKSFKAIFSIRFRKSHLLIFFNGFLLAALLYFLMENNYESKLFHSLALNVQENVAKDSSGMSHENAVLIHSLNLVYNLEKSRSVIFGPHNIDSWKSNLIQPLTFDLMTGQRACGGFSMVLARLLKEQNIEVRIPQMQVGDIEGGHIIVEAKTSYGWVVLDPSFNVYFNKDDNRLASFEDVHQNWASYSQNLPSDYNLAYRYEGVRYTNWSKIPVLMPVMKSALNLFWGKEKTESFSMRAALLEKFNVLIKATGLLYLITLFISVRYIIRRHRNAQINPVQLFPKMPVTPTVA